MRSMAPSVASPASRAGNGSNYAGSSGNTEFRAQDGSQSGSAGRGVVSFGNTADRALGALSTSNQVNRFGVIFRNDTAEVLTSISISYFGEYWRRGGSDLSNTLDFSFGIFEVAPSIDDPLTAFPALRYVPGALIGAASALDGNAAENRSFMIGNINNLTWNPGDYLVLAWSAQDFSGQDNGLAIDNFSFAAVPEPSTYAMIFGALALVGAVIRRRLAKS